MFSTQLLTPNYLLDLISFVKKLDQTKKKSQNEAKISGHPKLNAECRRNKVNLFMNDIRCSEFEIKTVLIM